MGADRSPPNSFARGLGAAGGGSTGGAAACKARVARLAISISELGRTNQSRVSVCSSAAALSEGKLDRASSAVAARARSSAGACWPSRRIASNCRAERSAPSRSVPSEPTSDGTRRGDAAAFHRQSPGLALGSGFRRTRHLNRLLPGNRHAEFDDARDGNSGRCHTQVVRAASLLSPESTPEVRRAKLGQSRGTRLGAWGLGLGARARGLGLAAWGLGLRLGLRAWGLRLGAWGLRLEAWAEAWGLRLGAWGLGLSAWGLRLLRTCARRARGPRMAGSRLHQVTRSLDHPITISITRSPDR